MTFLSNHPHFSSAPTSCTCCQYFSMMLKHIQVVPTISHLFPINVPTDSLNWPLTILPAAPLSCFVFLIVSGVGPSYPEHRLGDLERAFHHLDFRLVLFLSPVLLYLWVLPCCGFLPDLCPGLTFLWLCFVVCPS